MGVAVTRCKAIKVGCVRVAIEEVVALYDYWKSLDGEQSKP